MNKLHWKKGIACGGLFLALLGLTFYILLSDQDPGKLWTALGQAEWSWLAVGAACMMLFFCCEAKKHSNWFGTVWLSGAVRLLPSLRHHGVFFSSVTPSASGGQPMQLYAMYRDGHAPAPGALALLTDFFLLSVGRGFWASVGFSCTMRSCFAWGTACGSALHLAQCSICWWCWLCAVRCSLHGPFPLFGDG